MTQHLSLEESLQFYLITSLINVSDTVRGILKSPRRAAEFAYRTISVVAASFSRSHLFSCTQIRYEASRWAKVRSRYH